MQWFHKAADVNYAAAQNIVGFCFANGQGVEKDEKEAAKWYRKAGDQNFADAQNNLGNCHIDGKGVEKDVKEA